MENKPFKPSLFTSIKNLLGLGLIVYGAASVIMGNMAGVGIVLLGVLISLDARLSALEEVTEIYKKMKPKENEQV